MHRHAGRLVDGQQPVVLVQQRELARRGPLPLTAAPAIIAWDAARWEVRTGGSRTRSPAPTRRPALTHGPC
jgi:hypothetical protein